MSRLTSLPPGAAAEIGAQGPFNFRDFGSWVLLTNDWGRWLMLDKEDFKRFLSGRLQPSDPVRAELSVRGFLRESMEFPELAASFLKQTSFRHIPGPSLHMIVVTLRCNQKCRYCHSSVVEPHRTDTDMDLETAKRTVDFIFSTPNPSLCIEFQGGEPLLNWPVVKFIIQYGRAKAKALKRRLILALVNNFTLMTEERLDFLTSNGVSICTSLDGPADLHDKNRPFLGGGASAQEKVVAWVRRLTARAEADESRSTFLPSALMTTTRFSLGRGREIVDVYRELGMDQIFLRPLSPIGYAKRVWPEIGYEPEEFLRFYEDTLDYILELNRSGKSSIMERNALVLLTKIVKGEDPGFMDLRWPAGAALGCLAYNYDGRVFVSDEGRMVDHQGDPIFQIGTVDDPWTKVLDHPTTRACVSASNLETQPMCSQCAYKTWCGVEPVFHYEMQRSIAGRLPDSPWCRAHMGVFDVLMARLRDPETRRVFDGWLERDTCRWQENAAGPRPVPVQEAVP